MKRTFFVLAGILLIATGCSFSRKERVTIRSFGGTKIDTVAQDGAVHKAVDELIARNAWTSPRYHSTASIIEKTINGFVKKTVTRERSITARTQEGRLVTIRTTEVTGDPVQVDVEVEGDKGDSSALYASQLMALLDTDETRKNREFLKVTAVPSTIQVSDENITLTGNWISGGPWTAERLELKVEPEDRSRVYSSIWDVPAAWATESENEENNTGLRSSIEMSRRNMTVRLSASQALKQGAGTVELVMSRQYWQTISNCCSDINDAPTVHEFMRVFGWNMDADYVTQMHKAFGRELQLADYHKLKSYRVSAQFVTDFLHAGYDLSVAEVIKLENYRVDPDDARAFKKAGFDFSVSELIKADNYRLSPSLASAFKEAGYDFDLNKLIKAKNYRLDPKEAAAFKKLGYKFEIDELIKLNNYRVGPDFAANFKQAGYELDIDELIKADQYRIDSKWARELVQAGCMFSLSELIKLKQYRVPADYIITIQDSEYKPFTADEIIAFKQKRLDAETIKRIRRKK